MTQTMLDQSQLKTILPQAYPFLLIDRVTELEKGKSLTAIKNITANEWPFTDKPQMTTYPETLLIEAAAQAALVLYYVSMVERRPASYYLGKVKAEFMEHVSISDQVQFNVTAGRLLDSGGYADVSAAVDGREKAQFELFFSATPKDGQYG